MLHSFCRDRSRSPLPRDPEDEPDDVSRPVWAGVVPLHHTYGEPVDAPDLVEAFPVPGYISDWVAPQH